MSINSVFFPVTERFVLVKIGFLVTGHDTEFSGNKNSWFSHEKSSPESKENGSHFISLAYISKQYINNICKIYIIYFLNNWISINNL